LGNTYELKPSNSKTGLTLVLDCNLPYSVWGKMLYKLKIRKKIEKGIEKSFQNLKKILEK